MTASLMPPEVMEAINYAKCYVMLKELQVKVGERIATLVQAEGAMVTSGAASALTLGTAAVLTGTDQKKMVELPDLTTMKSRSSSRSLPFWLRPCRPQLRRPPGRGRNAGGSGTGGQSEDRDDALLQQQQQRGTDRTRSSFSLAKTLGADLQRRGGRRAAGREPVEVLRRWASTWWRFPAGRAFAARRAGVAARAKDLIAAARLNAPRTATPSAAA